MKVYSLSLLSVTPSTPAQATLLGSAQDLSSFSFYQRGSVGEFMTFFTKVRIGTPARHWPSYNEADIVDGRGAHTPQPTFLG